MPGGEDESSLLYPQQGPQGLHRLGCTQSPKRGFGGCQMAHPHPCAQHLPTGWSPPPFLTSWCCRTLLPPCPDCEPTQELSSQSQAPNCPVKLIPHPELSKSSPVGAAASTFTGLAQGCFCFMSFTMETVKERTCNSNF